MSQKKRVVLAFSGGLDTSVILKWLQTDLDYEVVCFTADLGQGEELEAARDKALLLGIKPEHIFIEDLTEEFDDAAELEKVMREYIQTMRS